MSFPSPPVLKTTIIQLNKELDSDGNNNNYEILTNNYNNNPLDKSPIGNSDDSMPTSPNLEALGPSKKKRRRSTANIDEEELAKRKHETKQLHSIIEKRRRIKINREFEALKYLIPACRNCNTTPPDQESSSSTKKSSNVGGGSNGNKIDGMYKLTILKSSVEYILYLHHIIQKQQELIKNDSSINLTAAKEFNIDFARIPLDVNQYRNIDVNFNFKTLLKEVQSVEGQIQRRSNEPKMNRPSWTPNHNKILEEEEEESHELGHSGDGDGDDNDNDNDNVISSSRSSSVAPSLPSIPSQTSISSTHKPLLPTPDFTPDMAPIFTMLNKYSDHNTERRNRKASYPISPQTFAIRSANPSPFTNPLKSTLSTTTSPSMRNYVNKNNSNINCTNNNTFTLPDPAITPSNSTPRDRVNEGSSTETSRNRNTPSTEVQDEVMEDGEEEQLNDRYASKTLLSLRKSSIGNLLN